MCLAYAPLESWQDYRATASYKYILSDVPQEVEELGKTVLRYRHGHIQYSAPVPGQNCSGLVEEASATRCLKRHHGLLSLCKVLSACWLAWRPHVLLDP